MNLFLWLEALVLLGAAAAAGLGAAWFPAEIAIDGKVVSESTARPVLAFLAGAFLAGAGVCLSLWWSRRNLGHVLELAGPKGKILITPHTVSQLTTNLLHAEFPEIPGKVELRTSKGTISLRVFLRAPLETPIPNLAQRIQDLLTTELSQLTGLAVQEVQVVVHGTTPTRS